MLQILKLNLTESNESNNWELMGSDIARLQELISQLEQARDEQQAEENQVDGNTTNSTDTNIISENTTDQQNSVDNVVVNNTVNE